MAEIKTYSLWLQQISIGGKRAPHPGGIPVLRFALSDSRTANVVHGGGGGYGKAQVDLLDLTIIDSNSAFVHMSQAHSSGANLGRGRLEAFLASGCSRFLLEFESALVASLSGMGRFAGGAHFNLQLSIDKPRILWRPDCH